MMDRPDFQTLLAKYLDGTCSEQERRLVEQWYALIGDLEEEPAGDEALDKRAAAIWHSIEQKTESPSRTGETRNKKPLLRSLFRYGAVAAVLLAAVLGTYLLSRTPAAQTAESHYSDLVEIRNTGSVSEPIALEDGSRLMLKPQSKVCYPRHFLKNRREVFLEGEGFFEVSKNPERPFFVYSKNIVTEVLGTSFDIRLSQGKIEVSVRTGRVAVFENGNRFDLNADRKIEHGVIITPNQRATYFSENKHFVKSLVDEPMPVPAPAQEEQVPPSFSYDDTPMRDVLRAIQKTYQVEISVENAGMENCPFTGDLSTQDLFKKINIICEAFQASYEVQGTKIIIHGGNECR